VTYAVGTQHIFYAFLSSKEVSVHSWNLCLPVLVIRDMAVCCVYRHGIPSELTVLFLVDADCLGSCHSSCYLTSTLLDGHFPVFFFKAISYWSMLVLVSGMTSVESHILFEVLGIQGIILAFMK
jgi:hypothetical protein